MENKLAYQTEQTGLAVKGSEQISSTQLVAREFAQRLKYMIINGNKLQDNDVYALAQYASATGLDPFAGECWIIPGKGVCPGIAGWRKKAQEQLEYEAVLAKEDGSHFWVEYSEATLNDCVFDPTKGDIAYIAILRDSVSQHRWRLSVIEATNDFMKMGAKFDQSLEQAKALVGAEPIWTGYGVVFNSETFGGLEKFDRRERAKKRAEKLALRKRFPRIHLPEPEGANDVVEVGDYSVYTEAVPQITAKQSMNDLGFDYNETTELRQEPEQPSLIDQDRKYKRLSGEVVKMVASILGLSNQDAVTALNEMYEKKLIPAEGIMETYQNALKSRSTGTAA